MSSVFANKGDFSVRAYRGDAKTLLAFNLTDKSKAKDLAGFTIKIQPKGLDAFYIQNNLRFEKPGDHAQDIKESPNASINAPIHKFRWLHVPGSLHQGLQPAMGDYTYTVTPRYFDANHSLTPLDANLSVSVVVEVDGFTKGNLELGFTRGFTQSQAFVNHFGAKALIRPKAKELLFDTSKESGVNAHGEHYTFDQEYQWLGFTAREKILELLNDVVKTKSLSLDVFAYDLNEPDVVGILVKLAKQKRLRIILDNATLHHDTSKPKPEDQVEKLLVKAGGKAVIKRGKFGRFAHDKVFVVSKKGASNKRLPVKVLTGSTNFSVTGLYVNSNHILVFNDAEIAGFYAGVFEQAWQGDVTSKGFVKSDWATKTFSSSSKKLPKIEFTFSPHGEKFATDLMTGIADRIAQEKKKTGDAVGSVLFAVMEMDKGKSPIFTTLKALHETQSIFSYGISDNPGGIALYPIGKSNGVLVTGKPASVVLPPPFNQVPGVGLGHQVHHKFVVCGFKDADAVVYCGSSNLAVLGEQVNGDNLLAIHDADVATVFAIEGLALVDHFDFLDRSSKGPKAKGDPKTKAPPASKQHAADSAGWFLSTSDGWTKKFFDPNDLHSVDRQLFA